MAKLKNYIPWYRKSFAVFGVNLTLLWQFSCFWQSFFVSHGQTMNFLAILQCDQIWRNIWQLFEGLISIWQTFEPTLENSVSFWAIYIAVNVQILSKHSRHHR